MRPDTPIRIVLYLVLGVFSVWYVVPFLIAASTSLKHAGMTLDGRWLPYARASTFTTDGREEEIRVVEEYGDTLLVRAAASGRTFRVPRAAIEHFSPNWKNYSDAWTVVPFGRYFLNSIFVSVCITLGQIVTCSLGGYAFSRLAFPGRDRVFLLYLATLMIPGPVLTVPIYLLLREYHLLNTYQGVILPGLFSAYGTFLLRQFFLTIPRELEDAARIDGAGTLTVYIRVILPLSVPALLALATFTFVGSWNDFFWPSIVLTDPDRVTLPVGLAQLNDIYLFQYNRLMAAGIMSIAPALLLYVLFQRFITRGVVMSGLKG